MRITPAAMTDKRVTIIFFKGNPLFIQILFWQESSKLSGTFRSYSISEEQGKYSCVDEEKRGLPNFSINKKNKTATLLGDCFNVGIFLFFQAASS